MRRRTPTGQRTSSRSRACSIASRSFRRTSSRWRGGRRSTTRPASATRSPPCCRRRRAASAPTRTRRACAIRRRSTARRASDARARRARRARSSSATRSTTLAGSPAGIATAELAARGIGADRSPAGHGRALSLRQDRVDRDPVRRRRAARRRGRRSAIGGSRSSRTRALDAAHANWRAPRDVPRGAAARRDRQRQDRDLPAAGGRGPRRGPAAC